MMRAARSIACFALILAAACGPKPRPASGKELESNDVSNCYRAATVGNDKLHGDGTMLLYVDADGAVPAAWFHDVGTLDSPQFFACLTSIAVEGHNNDNAPVDRVFGWVFNCDEGQCRIHALNTLPSAKFDEEHAQATLTFADWADATDKGWGYYYTHKYSDAAATFQAVVDQHPDDWRAERGLAESLLETGGDLKKAREAAEKAVAQKKNAASLEALVRVCLKQGDDECAVANFVDATKQPDVKFRSLDLAQLNDAAKAANDRLSSADEKRKADEEKARADAQAKMDAADPLGCYKLAGAEQAKCYVKRCFEAGAATYAAELRKLTGTEYVAGEMTAAAGEGGATIVTIPIRQAAGKKAKRPHKSAAEAENKDAVFTVTLGDNISMLPYKQNLSANNIAHDHNACSKK